MIIQGSPEILRGPRGLNGFGDFGSIGAFTTVEDLYQGIIGREVSNDPSSPFYDTGLKYFQDRFGSEISADEVAIFEQMAAAEVAQRVAYFDELERQRNEARRAGIEITLRQQLDADGAIAIADGTVFGPDMCPPGSMMVDGVCIGDPSTYGPKVLIDQDIKQPVTVVTEFKKTDTTGGINPALILAVAAAFFFAG